jgi:hypothetical protein
MFPAFHNLTVDEIHLKWPVANSLEIELISEIAKRHHVAVESST